MSGTEIAVFSCNTEPGRRTNDLRSVRLRLSCGAIMVPSKAAIARLRKLEGRQKCKACASARRKNYSQRTRLRRGPALHYFSMCQLGCQTVFGRSNLLTRALFTLVRGESFSALPRAVLRALRCWWSPFPVLVHTMETTGAPAAVQKSSQAAPSPVVPTARERDEFVHQVYQSVIQSRRGDWINLLHCAPFASQHHMSAYSLVKYGASGAPYIYLPLTLQQPEATETILKRQRAAETRAWVWQMNSRTPPPPPTGAHAPLLRTQQSAETTSNPATSEFDAVEDAVADAAGTTSCTTSSEKPPLVKTSETHPIKYVLRL